MTGKKLTFKTIEDVLKVIKSLKNELDAIFVIVANRSGKILITSEGSPLFMAEPDRIIFMVSQIAISLQAAESAQVKLRESPTGIIIEGRETDIIVNEIDPATILIFQISVEKIWTKVKIARAIRNIKEILEREE